MGYFSNDRQQRSRIRYAVFGPNSTAYIISRKALMEEINRLIDEGHDFDVMHWARRVG